MRSFGDIAHHIYHKYVNGIKYIDHDIEATQYIATTKTKISMRINNSILLTVEAFSTRVSISANSPLL